MVWPIVLNAMYDHCPIVTGEYGEASGPTVTPLDQVSADIVGRADVTAMNRNNVGF